MAIRLGKSFEVGAFHDGSGQPAGAAAKIKVTGRAASSPSRPT